MDIELFNAYLDAQLCVRLYVIWPGFDCIHCFDGSDFKFCLIP